VNVSLTREQSLARLVIVRAYRMTGVHDHQLQQRIFISGQRNKALLEAEAIVVYRG
jgi:hypothetical protein